MFFGSEFWNNEADGVDMNQGSDHENAMSSSAPANQEGSKPNLPMKAKRQMRNFLLQPLLQIKLGIYMILLTSLFSSAIAGILYVNLARFAAIVLQLTDVEDEVTDLLNAYMHDTRWYLGSAILVFLLLNVMISVLYTHRLVGPTYAFRRHIRALSEGRYQIRTILRKGDAFAEVADELNHLSEVLERRQSGEKTTR